MKGLRLALLILALGLGLAVPTAWAEPQGRATLRTAREGCRQVALDTARLFPALCRTKVHWFLAVDTSRSMLGPKIDTAKSILRQWLELVAVEGDLVTVVAYDDRVRALSPLQVKAPGERSSLLQGVMKALAVVQGREAKGTCAGEARAKVLELARKAGSAPESPLPILLVLGDRDDDDGAGNPRNPPADRPFQGTLVWRQEGQPRDQVWGQKSYFLEPDGAGKAMELVLLTSGSRRAERVAQGGLEPREIPVVETRPAPPPPRPVDPWKTARRAIPWSFLAPFLVAGLCLVRLRSGRAGALRHRESNSQATLRWNLVGGRPLHVKASKNDPSLALVPLRDDLGDPVVLRASLAAPWSWTAWRLHLETLTGYSFQETAHRTQETLLAPGEDRQVLLVDHRGPVSRGTLEWKPDGRTQWAWRSLVVLAAVGLILVLAAPALPDLLPAPPVAAAPAPAPDSEPLFDALGSLEPAPGPAGP